MSELISANWNFQYGMDNPTNVLNKVTHFGVLPINQHYVFFKNGATSMMQNDQNMAPEVKQALQNEKVLRNRNDHGDGTARPVGFIEAQMNDLYYNSFGIDIDIVSRPYTVDPLTVVLITGGYTSLLALLVAQSIALMLQMIVDQLFSSVIRAQMPKIGYTDYYTYEKKNPADPNSKILSEIVKRNHPYVEVDDAKGKKAGKIQKDKLINLSSESAFKKITGVSSYDTILSKYQFNGGCGFYSSIFKNIGAENTQNFIETLKANSDIKYQQLNKLAKKYASKDFSKFLSSSQTKEKDVLNKMKFQVNQILRPISAHIDFSDYKTVLVTPTQKGYPNPQKEKSIFGPYICRSRKVFLYYPKIIVQDLVMSTISTQSNGIPYQGALDLFGAPATCYSISVSDNLYHMDLILRMASMGILPQIFGGCKFLTKDTAFNLGSSYQATSKKESSKSVIKGKYC